ncbi:hypothetical protein BVX99_03430 [bacterium F16]|nr:hypothetical protein BVX99_03430 [bacterium F16]
MIFYATGEVRGVELDTHVQMLECMERLGLKTCEVNLVCRTIDDVLDAIDELNATRDELSYDIAGAVVKVNDYAKRETLGFTSRFPRWAIAYKYPAEKAITQLKAITIQVGRTGVLTPVAELEPVFISGSTVSRATLHNFDELERKGIRVGDFVEIEKAGEIIPAVIRPIIEKRTGGEHAVERPTTCPVCNAEVISPVGEVAIRCVNSACDAQLKNKLVHFASRNAMDIDSLGESNIEHMIDKGFIKDAADIYELTPSDGASLARLEGFGDGLVKNILKGIDKSRSNPPWRLIHGLGIRMVGQRSAQRLMDYFGSLDALMAADVETLLKVEDVGDKVAAELVAYFSDETNKSLIERLKAAGVTMAQTKVEAVDSLFSGKTCVLTGSLQKMTRDEAKELLITLGANPSNSISKKTDYLIAGEKAGSKLKKAESLGVTTLTEDEFLAMASARPGESPTPDSRGHLTDESGQGLLSF